ncbi:MAG: hypothetical protein ACXQS2_02790 [Methermicoccaceae archaeon]
MGIDKLIVHGIFKLDVVINVPNESYLLGFYEGISKVEKISAMRSRGRDINA